MGEVLEIKYSFHSQETGSQNFTIQLDSKANLIQSSTEEGPSWTLLEYEKCSHCPLKESECKYCPIAYNLNKVIEKFGNAISHVNAKIEVEVAERTYSKEAQFQTGLQSFFGLVMATSGCPYLDFLKPMARFHLPFSTLDETLVRALSFYLLRQYFVAHKGGTPDWDLKGLDQAYAKVILVNQGLALRLGKMRKEFLKKGDASPNAITILDSFAQILTYEFETEFESIATFFE